MKLTEFQRNIFTHLFEVGRSSRDPEGVVSACLVDASGKIVVSSASADDAIRHAEDLVIEKAARDKIEITPEMVLYTTLEPCSRRLEENNVEDCTTIIKNSGVKKIIIGARDPEWSMDTKDRLEKADREYCLIEDDEIEEKCIELFNSTLHTDLDKMKLPRKTAL